MTPEVNLTVIDELGNTRQVSVNSKRFSIGRTPDNDLAIEHSSLSRRHAVIENFDGQVHLTDCGSQNGTEVNGSAILASAVLHDGDLITLGGVCDIEVVIASVQSNSPSPPRVAVGANRAIRETQNVSALPVSRPAPSPKRAGTWLGTTTGQLVAAGAGLLVIVVSVGLLLFIVHQAGPTRNTNRGQGNPKNSNIDVSQENSSPQSETSPLAQASPIDGDGNGSNSTVNISQIEASAAGVMHRLSSDDKTYGFSEKALQDIARRVNEYRSSPTLAANLTAVQRNVALLNGIARQQGMESGLLIYVVLTLAEANHGGDPRTIAQGVIGDLLALRATFGTNDADSSLIVLAAFKMGSGEKKSHPLLSTIRHLVKNPLVQRNVWYLNDKGGLDPGAYNFVVSVLALGVISQNPAQFGVSSPPLVF